MPRTRRQHDSYIVNSIQSVEQRSHDVTQSLNDLWEYVKQHGVNDTGDNPEVFLRRIDDLEAHVKQLRVGESDGERSHRTEREGWVQSQMYSANRIKILEEESVMRWKEVAQLREQMVYLKGRVAETKAQCEKMEYERRMAEAHLFSMKAINESLERNLKAVKKELTKEQSVNNRDSIIMID